MNTLHLIPFSKPVNKTVTIPGSKSYTNRALLLAALTDNPVTMSNPLICDDTEAMASCLRTLGIKIIIGKNKIKVIGSIRDIQDKKFQLNANLSGTTLRFLLPLLCLVKGIKILDGEEGLRKRPIKILVDALRTLGTDITYLGKEGFPPLKITSSTLKSENITLDGSVSSQFISALLMIAPLIGNVTITIKGIVVSKPYIDMTIDSMEKFGVHVLRENQTTYIFSGKQQYSGRNIVIEGDFSSAGYFLGIAALTKSRITLKNLNPNSLQADKKILDVLKKMGNKIIFGKNEIIISGKGVQPFSADVTDFPDSAQALAVLAAFAKGTSKLSGIQTLRMKETDRVQALQNELEKMGIKTVANAKTLTVFGGNPHAAKINTYGDHRMAMSFAIACSKLSGMEIENPDVVSKTFPDFWKELKKIGVGVKEKKSVKQNIVLIGFMGSGKSSLAPVLAKRLGFKSLEMDEVVLKRSGEKSIKDIFEKLGESHFRKLEEEVAKSLEKEQHAVASAGGGVVMNDKTMKLLARNATVIFLATEFSTIEKRLHNSTGRPLWNDKKKAKELFDLRQALYAKSADCVIRTDGKSLDKIAKEVIEHL